MNKNKQSRDLWSNIIFLQPHLSPRSLGVQYGVSSGAACVCVGVGGGSVIYVEIAGSHSRPWRGGGRGVECGDGS